MLMSYAIPAAPATVETIGVTHVTGVLRCCRRVSSTRPRPTLIPRYLLRVAIDQHPHASLFEVAATVASPRLRDLLDDGQLLGGMVHLTVEQHRALEVDVEPPIWDVPADLVQHRVRELMTVTGAGGWMTGECHPLRPARPRAKDPDLTVVDEMP